VCYRVRDTSTKRCCDQDWDEERWGFTRPKKWSPAQASTALRVAFCLLRRALAFFLFFCFMASCRFANCAICSLVAGFMFALMVYGYRIIVVLRCRWLITPVIRGKISSLISRLCAGATAVAEIFFEQPVRLLRDYRGFPHRGSRNYFLRIFARLSRPAWRLTRRSKSVSTCMLVGFSLLWGCSNVFRSQNKTRATPGKRHSARSVRGELFSSGLRVTTRAI